MGKPDAPTPPNPYQTAAAQTGTNVATGVANAFLNNMNQRTPTGSLNYDVTGNYSWQDPSTGQTYNIPRFTSTQTLTPDQEAIRNRNENTQGNLARMGDTLSLNMENLLSNRMDMSGAPAAGDPNAITNVPQAATSYDPGGAIQTGFGDAGDITRSYGAGDFSADRSHVEDALMARINPQLAQERGRIEQQLADQGIRYGSQAYTSAMDNYNRQATDTRFGAIGQAGQEQQRMMDMAAKRAGFENSAQQQAYEQQLGRGSFYNAAQAQQNSQNAALAGFGNAGLAQQLAQAQSGFNARNAGRNQWMQEQYAQRNQPLNEISALMSGSQVTQTPWLNSPTSQIATTDIGGLINQNFAQQSQNYQSANQNWQSTIGGLLGLGGKLGGAAIMKSDERSKENIVPMGTVFAATPDGERKPLPVSQWSYKGESARHVGPMAQDVEKIDKSAVTTRGGVKHIYPAKVMGSILRAA
jgi:Chaperone of endosialidase